MVGVGDAPQFGRGSATWLPDHRLPHRPGGASAPTSLVARSQLVHNRSELGRLESLASLGLRHSRGWSRGIDLLAEPPEFLGEDRTDRADLLHPAPARLRKG